MKNLLAILFSLVCFAASAQTLIPTGGGSGGGTPGGSDTQCQYNNAGAFGGITGCTTNGTAVTFVAPVLGTPASGTLTNTTGFPVANLAGAGTGVLTALAINVGSAGAPVLFNGALGTPSSGTLTNATGLPIGGITGFGTGIATALAVNVGTAGAPVINGGALGSPSSAGTIPAFTLGGTIAGGGNQLNNIIIGTTTPLAGSFTTMVGTTLALGGATIGSNVLAVTGSTTISNGLSVSGSAIQGLSTPNSFISSGDIQVAAAHALYWAGRINLYSPAATTLQIQDGIGAINSYITIPASASIQQGQADAASPVAQTTKVQSVVAGTSNTAGAPWTLKDSAGTGTGISGGYSLQVAPAGSTGTSQNAYSAAFTIAGGTGLIATPLITSDATHTDSAVCQDTTTHAMYSGSGTLGVCLGTSSARYKQEATFRPLSDGLNQLMALRPINYFYKPGHGDGGAREQYGMLAEDVLYVLPKLVHLDVDGLPNSIDLVGMIPIIIKAIQELKADNDNLRLELKGLRNAQNDNFDRRFSGVRRVFNVR